MGGFVADIQNIHDTSERVTFTANGVVSLAKHGYLCKVKKCNIEDKSKADKFAKGVGMHTSRLGYRASHRA
jgi:hypothetical protein